MTNTCDCGRPTAGAHLCDRCHRTFSYALVNTAAYYLELETVARKQTRFGDPGGGGRAIGKTQPLVVDGRFLDDRRIADGYGRKVEAVGKGTELRRDTETIVTTWAQRVADRSTSPGPVCEDPCLHVSCANISRSHGYHLPDRRTVPALVAYLARHLRWILTQPWCTEMLAEFLTLESRLTRMIDSPPATWYAGKCSVVVTLEDGEQFECQHELYARADRGFIDCPGCGTRHDVAERREFLLREAQHIYVTATQAAQALIAWTDYDGTEKKLVDRIYRWMDRDQLEIREVISFRGKDRHLYRLGDIQALLIESAQAKQAKRVGAPT